jgi:thiol-disulfide isomerase/thioredoxin
MSQNSRKGHDGDPPLSAGNSPGSGSSPESIASPRRRWLAYGAQAVGAGAQGARTPRQRRSPSEAEDHAAELLFALNLPGADGQAVSIGKWRGQPVVVNFWATWCPPCIEEMPELSALQQQFEGRGVQILGIGIDSPDSIQRISQTRPVAYPLLVSGAGGS